MKNLKRKHFKLGVNTQIVHMFSNIKPDLIIVTIFTFADLISQCRTRCGHGANSDSVNTGWE